LIKRHEEPHRHYHTLQHLDECFARLDELRALASDAPAVELALWFHDAIYAPRRDDNEARSAALAETSLLAAGVDPARVRRIRDLVLATRHQQNRRPREREEPAPFVDRLLVIDIDLAILGADPPRFDEYQRQVRAEYAWVPETVYRERRAALLASFLSRPTIYATLPMIERFEAPARRNLAHAIASLEA
jgi:predicted metal-dependent HD superfamily phosphohydrolase